MLWIRTFFLLMYNECCMGLDISWTFRKVPKELNMDESIPLCNLKHFFLLPLHFIKYLHTQNKHCHGSINLFFCFHEENVRNLLTRLSQWNSQKKWSLSITFWAGIYEWNMLVYYFLAQLFVFDNFSLSIDKKIYMQFY